MYKILIFSLFLLLVKSADCNANSSHCDVLDEPYIENDMGMFIESFCNDMLIVHNFSTTWDGNRIYNLNTGKDLYVVTNIEYKSYKKGNNYIESYVYYTPSFQCTKEIHRSDILKDAYLLIFIVSFLGSFGYTFYNLSLKLIKLMY